MAKASKKIIQALRNTASSLEKAANYQWGHMGSCNCGFLAQEVTKLNKDQIHSMAMQRYGDWSEQLNDYCPTSGLLIDDLISELIKFGFDSDDLKKLERLSDTNILRNLRSGKRYLNHNSKEDVVDYLSTWADLLEMELVDWDQLTAPEKPTPVKEKALIRA